MKIRPKTFHPSAKNWTLAVLLLPAAILVTVFLLGGIYSNTVSAADPLKCGSGATLVPAAGSTPAYCTCPANQTLTDANSCTNPIKTDPPSTAKYYCGRGESKVSTSINIGCRHAGTALTDALFAIIRFLTAGVGLIVIASMVVAGIQYASSRGDPQATASAIDRIRSNVIALLVFMFAYAMLNYVIPGVVF